MSPVLWGTLTALGRGSADFASRFSSSALGHANSLLGMLLVGSVVLTLWVAFAGTPLGWTWSGLWLLAVTGVGVMSATLLLYHGLARGPMTVVAPIVGSYPALVVAIALILGSRPTPVQWAAMAAIIAGLIVVARFAPAAEETDRGDPFAPGSQGPGAEITAVAASGFGGVTVVLARIFLGEAMSGRQWAGIVVTFAGVAVLVGHS